MDDVGGQKNSTEKEAPQVVDGADLPKGRLPENGAEFPEAHSGASQEQSGGPLPARAQGGHKHQKSRQHSGVHHVEHRLGPQHEQLAKEVALDPAVHADSVNRHALDYVHDTRQLLLRIEAQAVHVIVRHIGRQAIQNQGKKKDAHRQRPKRLF